MVFWYIKWYRYMSKYTIHIIYQTISKIFKDHLWLPWFHSFDSRPGSWRRATSSAQVLPRLPWAQKSDWGMDEILPYFLGGDFSTIIFLLVNFNFLISCVCWRVVNDILIPTGRLPAGSLGRSVVFNATPSNIVLWEQPWRTYIVPYFFWGSTSIYWPCWCSSG